jgi:predicted lipid-binding transport protein (Tim44 family)
MMGDLFSLIDILIFAMIAAFLVFRLRSVLGRRTGNERQRPNPFAIGQGDRTGRPAPGDNVVSLPGREGPEPAPGQAAPVGQGLTQIKIADPSFTESGFVAGAKAAFGMIVEAFSKGDTGTLRPLLSDDLYDEFSGSIRDRLAAGQTLDSRVEQMKAAEIIDARMDGRTALVTVRFDSRQVNVTRNEAGEVTDGSPDEATEVTDIWTFARNTRSNNPNWTLVETRTPV